MQSVQVEIQEVPPRRAGWRRLAGVAALLGTAGLSVAGCSADAVDEAPQAARPVAKVRAAPLPPLEFRPLPGGGQVVSVGDVYFASDRTELTAPARAQLRDRLVSRVKSFLRQPGAVVAVRGYADGVGDATYNTRLSAARAESVAALLRAAGVPAARLRSHGFGERLARDERPDAEIRRVDVILLEGGTR